MVALVLVGGGDVGVVDRNAIPGQRDVLLGKVQQELVELGADPGVPGEVGPVAPSADESKGLAPAFSSRGSVVVDSDRLPLQLGCQFRKIRLWDIG